VNKRQLLSESVIITLMVSGAGLAQASDPVFEEVLVTAQKRSESIYDVPKAISAFSAEGMQKAGITDIVDIGKLVPNLTITTFGAGSASSANPFIRGLGLQDHIILTDPAVGVYVDGVYLGRQVGQNLGLSNVERVEVLRGPQGTLYGRNSLGGAINIITRQPGDEEQTHIGFEVGSRGRVNANFYSNFKLSDTFSAIISSATKRREGVGKYLNLPQAEKDVGELQDISSRIAVRWTPSDRFTLNVTADANKGDNGLVPYTTLADEVPNGLLVGQGVSNADISSDPYNSNTTSLDLTSAPSRAHGVSLVAELELTDNLTGKLILSKRKSNFEAGLDDDDTARQLFEFPERGFVEQLSTEIQINGEYENIHFVSGLYYFEEEGYNSQPETIFNGDPGSFLVAQDLKSYAVYSNVGFQVNEELRVALGLRYTDDTKDARTNLSDFAITSSSADFSEVTGDLSVTYEISDALTAYGTVATGYQSGQFPARPYCLFGNIDTTQPGNVTPVNCFEATDNITAVNYEAGIKGTPLDNLQLSVAAFRTEYSDLPIQVSTTSSAGFDTRNEIVEQVSQGLELESSLNLFDGFFINASIGYIDAKIEDDPQAVVPLTPEMTASLAVEYTVDVATGGQVTMRVDYSFRDEMYGESSPDPLRGTSIDSRDLINFNISYLSSDETWRVGVYGRNVTDERYVNATLNTGDWITQIWSNDPSEFGIQFSKYIF
jgi:iron complex outermembrane recepter protein